MKRQTNNHVDFEYGKSPLLSISSCSVSNTSLSNADHVRLSERLMIGPYVICETTRYDSSASLETWRHTCELG